MIASARPLVLIGCCKNCVAGSIDGRIVSSRGGYVKKVNGKEFESAAAADARLTLSPPLG